MKQKLHALLTGLLYAIPLGLAVWFMYTLAVIWWARLHHPYDLEWMEGGMLAHAWRLQHGLELYPEPGQDFIAMIYPPGYPTVLAVVGWVVGIGHDLGRFFSLAGSLAAAAAIAWGTSRHGKSWWVGILGGVTFLALYPESGAFYDLVRPDALAMGLLAWSIVLGMERGRHAPIAAGLLLAAAFVCKHNAAAFGFPMALGIWARSGWKVALRFSLAALVPALVFTGIITLSTSGRFIEYLISVPGSHPMVVDRVVPGTPQELAHALPVACVVIATWLIVRSHDWAPSLPIPLMVGFPVTVTMLTGWLMLNLDPVRGIQPASELEKVIGFGFLGAIASSGFLVLIGMGLTRKLSWRWVYGCSIGATALVTAGIMRGHHGGFINVFIPMHWVVCFGFAVIACDMRRRMWPTSAAALVCALFTSQLAISATRLDPEALTPTDADRAAGDEMVAALAEFEGPVLSPFAPWLAYQAGHEPSFHLIALWDIKHNGGPFRDNVPDISTAVRDRHWNVIVDASDSMGYGVVKYYKVQREFSFRGKAMMPKTGWRRRPVKFMVPQ